MKVRLKIWRQKDTNNKGNFEMYTLDNISKDMSFLEMLDVLNEQLVTEKKDPVAFDSDCREGICGSCGIFIDGRAHGPRKATTTCQLHMREFSDNSVITLEPWRSTSFPVLKDLVVDRTSFDNIIQSGGYISINTGSAQDANAVLVPQEVAKEAFSAAACIGCGACVATCKNSSAMLFTSAKISHLALLPQGAPERAERAKNMIQTMDAEGFGNCSNTGACEIECPKEISIQHIARTNREYLRSTILE